MHVSITIVTSLKTCECLAFKVCRLDNSPLSLEKSCHVKCSVSSYLWLKLDTCKIKFSERNKRKSIKTIFSSPTFFKYLFFFI